MSNNSINLLSNIFSNSVSLNHHSPRGSIEDDWEYINYLDRQLGSGDGSGSSAGKEYASINGVDSVMGDQDKPDVMKYKVLSRAEVRRLLEDKITTVSTVCLLSKDEAAILLQHFKWCVNHTITKWLFSEEEVSDAVGLFERPVPEIPVDTTEINCKRCRLGGFPRNSVFSASCGHLFCRSCWEDYIRHAVNDGPRCLTLQCPETSCNAVVGLYMKEHLSSEADQVKFENLLLKSYVACLPEAKWCPAPDCNYAVFSYNDEDTVTCRCLHSFCWRCSREAHVPVDCDTVAKWMSESPRQSENWVLANAVTCPNCKFQYEKEIFIYCVNCTVCKHEFCSVCGDDWSNHENIGGLGNISCCRNGDNTVTESFKKSLERYNHHYEGWITCESSKANVMSDLKVFQDLQLDHLCVLFGLSSTDFNFLVEALGQAVKCWQLLKWTYVYGYYLSEDDHARIPLLGFIQEDAKGLVRRLHEQVGKLQNFLHEEDVRFVQLTDLREKIITMTGVIRKYLHHWEVSLVAGMPEVVCIPKVNPRLKMSRERWESSCSQESEDAGPNTRPRLKTSQEMWESSCSQISPTASLSSRVMKWEGDIDISSPVNSTKSDESWDLVEPELELLNLNFSPNSSLKITDCNEHV